MKGIKERVVQLGNRHVAKLLCLVDASYKGDDRENFKKGVKSEMWNLVQDFNTLLDGNDEYFNKGALK